MSRVLNFVARQDARRISTTADVCRSDGSLARAAFAAPAASAPIAADAGRGEPAATPDYTVEDKGTLLLLRSTHARAYEWLVTHTDPAAHWFGRALVVEHGYIADFVAQLRVDGFTVDETSG
jgi:hypothetical protein